MGSSCSTQFSRTKRRTVLPSKSLALNLPSFLPFPFLSLPRELRNEIYIYILRSPTSYIYAADRIHGGVKHVTSFSFGYSGSPWSHSYFPGAWTPAHHIGLSLLLTCSQIRLEATPYFYTQNTFICPSLTARILQNTMAKHIRHLCIVARIDYYYPASASERLACLTRNLRLVARMSMLETLATGIVFERRIYKEQHFDDICTAKFSAACAEMLARDCAACDESIQERRQKRREKLVLMRSEDVEVETATMAKVLYYEVCRDRVRSGQSGSLGSDELPSASS